jgi:hypothetical protein
LRKRFETISKQAQNSLALFDQIYTKVVANLLFYSEPKLLLGLKILQSNEEKGIIPFCDYLEKFDIIAQRTSDATINFYMANVLRTHAKQVVPNDVKFLGKVLQQIKKNNPNTTRTFDMTVLSIQDFDQMYALCVELDVFAAIGNLPGMHYEYTVAMAMHTTRYGLSVLDKYLKRSDFGALCLTFILKENKPETKYLVDQLALLWRESKGDIMLTGELKYAWGSVVPKPLYYPSVIASIQNMRRFIATTGLLLGSSESIARLFRDFVNSIGYYALAQDLETGFSVDTNYEVAALFDTMMQAEDPKQRSELSRITSKVVSRTLLSVQDEMKLKKVLARLFALSSTSHARHVIAKDFDTTVFTQLLVKYPNNTQIQQLKSQLRYTRFDTVPKHLRDICII